MTSQIEDKSLTQCTARVTAIDVSTVKHKKLSAHKNELTSDCETKMNSIKTWLALENRSQQLQGIPP